MKFELREEVQIEALCQRLDLRYAGSPSQLISHVASLRHASEGCLTFSYSTEDTDLARVTVVSGHNPALESQIISENPRRDFIQALDYLSKEIGFKQKNGEGLVHESVLIGQNAVIPQGVRIGKGTVIEPNVVLFPNVVIGENCLIRANATLGSEGFGFEKMDDGSWLRFPHLGGVVVGNNVEIGSNSCVARGTLNDTIIEDHVKIDNLVHVAHNCVIKRGAQLIASVMISGSVTIRENAVLAPNATISDNLDIGKNSLIGLGAVVSKDVLDDQKVMGSPAKFLGKR